LREGESGYGKEDSEDPDRRGCEALRAFGQSKSPVVFRLLRLCWQKKAAGKRRPFTFTYRLDYCAATAASSKSKLE
jgi:hypothetical protein